MKRLVLVLLLSTTTYAADPIPRVGTTCPNGYHGRGEYCLPNNPEVKTPVIVKGTTCPNSYHREGGQYCVPNNAKTVKTIIPLVGDTCPSNYHRQGEYCQRNI